MVNQIFNQLFSIGEAVEVQASLRSPQICDGAKPYTSALDTSNHLVY